MTIRIFAHRGLSAEQPENTLAAFRAAVDAGADGIELDVRLARDGVPVVIHDATLDRTTDASGPVRARTAAELARVDAGRGEGVPTLDAVLALAAGRVEANVEVKDPEAVPAVLEVAARHPGLAWFASSFDAGAIQDLRARSAAVRLYPVALGDAGARLDDVLALAAEVGAEGLSVDAGRLTPAVAARVRAAGLRLWAWTVNAPDVAAALPPVDALCTDGPLLR